MQLPLQFDATYFFLQVEFYVICPRQLGPIANHMW